MAGTPRGKPGLRLSSGPTRLAELLSASPMLSAQTAHISLNDWRRAVGDKLAQRTHPERVAEGILTVRVPSSTWAQELSLLSQVVLDRLQTAGHRIQRLRFHVSPGPPEADTPVTTVRRAELPTRLQQTIARVADPELRGLISEAASLSLGRKPD